ncbi:MAG: hypothetical protein K6C68_04765 [Ruminococcus sp.]|nr:hypothetical protein [Ruminococcus sp.]
MFLLCSVLPGIIPLVLIFRFKLDLSEYFLKQIIFTMVSGFFCVVSWAFAFTGIPLIAPPAFLLIYFIINWRTLGDTRFAFIEDKLAVAASCLSSPLVLYMESLIVFLLALAYHR